MDSSVGQQRPIEVWIKAACGNQLHIKERKGERKKQGGSPGARQGTRPQGVVCLLPEEGGGLAGELAEPGGSLAIVATENCVLKWHCAVSEWNSPFIARVLRNFLTGAPLSDPPNII